MPEHGVKVKTVRFSLAFNLNVGRLSVSANTVPMWVAWVTSREAGITLCYKNRVSWSAYPHWQFRIGFGFRISISSGEFGKARWPESIDV